MIQLAFLMLIAMYAAFVEAPLQLIAPDGAKWQEIKAIVCQDPWHAEEILRANRSGGVRASMQKFHEFAEIRSGRNGQGDPLCAFDDFFMYTDVRNIVKAYDDVDMGFEGIDTVYIVKVSIFGWHEGYALLQLPGNKLRI